MLIALLLTGVILCVAVAIVSTRFRASISRDRAEVEARSRTHGDTRPDPRPLMHTHLLDPHQIIAWDMDETLIDGPNSAFFRSYIAGTPHKRHHIVTFRTGPSPAKRDGSWADDALHELAALGLPQESITAVHAIPEPLYLAYLKTKGDLTHADYIAWISWKGAKAAEIGATVLVDDMEAHVTHGCQLHGIGFVNSHLPGFAAVYEHPYPEFDEEALLEVWLIDTGYFIVLDRVHPSWRADWRWMRRMRQRRTLRLFTMASQIERLPAIEQVFAVAKRGFEVRDALASEGQKDPRGLVGQFPAEEDAAIRTKPHPERKIVPMPKPEERRKIIAALAAARAKPTP